MKLLAIALLKLGPSPNVVAKPFPQLGAWAGVLQPRLDLQDLLPTSARPDAIHEETSAVGHYGRLERGFEFDHP
jgi:hypothetical protein